MHLVFTGCGTYNVGTRIELAEKFTEESVLGLVGVGKQLSCFPLKRKERKKGTFTSITSIHHLQSIMLIKVQKDYACKKIFQDFGD